MENKKISEIFSDYKESNPIKNCRLEEIKIAKNINESFIEINSQNLIEIKDIYNFENYVNNRFKFAKTNIKINYESQIDFDVKSQWENIVCYLAHRNPFCKTVFLNCANIDKNDDVLNIKINVPAIEYIKSQKIDKQIKRMLKNFYNLDYKINIEKANDIIDSNKRLRDLQYLEEVKDLTCQIPVENSIENEKSKVQKEEKEEKIQKEKVSDDEDLLFGYRPRKNVDYIKIDEISLDYDYVGIKADILSYESKTLKTNKELYAIDVYDGTTSMTIKVFVPEDQKDDFASKIKSQKRICAIGKVQDDLYSGEITLIANTILKEKQNEIQMRQDLLDEKRVELHMHTKMSMMDAMASATDLINRAISWGMDSIAITDHGVVQAFPEAHKLLGYDNDKIKVIYGVEAYLVPDEDDILFGNSDSKIEDQMFCVFDLETTGFNAINERITEIGAMKIKGGKVIDTFSTFVNPQKPIPPRVAEVTNITDDMVEHAPKIEEILPKFLEFTKDCVLVAHNASFDIGFIKQNAKRLGYDFDCTYLDTLALSKAVYPELKRYKLGKIAQYLGINVLVAHRALDDVDTTVKVFNEMIKELKNRGAITVNDISKYAYDEIAKKERYKKLKSYHAIILAKNYVGLKNLYKLVSLSHLDYFYRNPRILRSLYDKYSEGLILGSACEAGELYQALLMGQPDEEVEKIAKKYDYLEIQPLGNNEFLLRNGTLQSIRDLQEINRKIVALGEKLEKKVVATCDVHFLDPQDEIYRRILEAGLKYDDADNQAPLYLRTTQEMLDEFAYLGEDKAYEVVVTNTRYISSLCEKISPISSEKCPPHIPGCEVTIKEIAYNRAHELYGEVLPEIVQKRLDKELDSIIKNGFSVMYIIAQKLVWKSNEDGYLVGSRGSVGSSFVANMTGITEVNSLPPHYRCSNCKYSEFVESSVKCGFDLPDKLCPECGTPLDKDGMDIPFETFLGFNGDKEPDIDLNFSGEYQAKAHKYTEVIFGEGTTFKAGTIGTVADKTAFGYVKGYYEDRQKHVNQAEIKRLSVGCTGIKRTTGQHPGGIIVVPKRREIYEFCPVQHPADDASSDIITTHFDYHSIDQNLLKLDILGHDDPTMIRMLQDISRVDPHQIPLDDKQTMSIFSGTSALGVTPEQIHSEVGSYGIPEFGTAFSRGMLVDTRPTTFEELIRISGLSHGTDVWLGNAQTLIQEKTATLSEAICTRDDIMTYLISMGLPPNDAFKIMEAVRKGKVAKGKEPKWNDYYVPLMKEKNVPQWYIDSCHKIKYMFPKAHAAAYVTMAFRIAWFKVHMPLAYYAAYFSIRATDFNADLMIRGKQKVIEEMTRLEQDGMKTAKDKGIYSILEIVLEFYERGFKFLNVDIYKSKATKFVIENNAIRPSLCSIPGMGEIAGTNIENASKEGEFLSIQDLKQKAKIGDSTVELLNLFNCLNGMSKTNQLSLFDL